MICCASGKLFLFPSYEPLPMLMESFQPIRYMRVGAMFQEYREHRNDIEFELYSNDTKRHERICDRFSICSMTSQQSIMIKCKNFKSQADLQLCILAPALTLGKSLTSLKFNSFNFKMKIAAITSYNCHEN